MRRVRFTGGGGSEQVIEWLGAAEGGRFAQVNVVPGTTGRELLRMNARKLTELVVSEAVPGRDDGEGWFITAQVGRAPPCGASYSYLIYYLRS